MSCPKGHPTPKEFRPGIEIRCPYTKDGINCDAVYTVGQSEPEPAKSAPRPADRGATTRMVG